MNTFNTWKYEKYKNTTFQADNTFRRGMPEDVEWINGISEVFKPEALCFPLHGGTKTIAKEEINQGEETLHSIR